MKNLQFAKLIEYKRINSSNMGNPNYAVTLEDGNGDYIYTRSSSNASWCYGINDKWLEKTISYNTTKSGRIGYMQVTTLADVFADPILTNKGE